jgi:hypothetical protein
VATIRGENDRVLLSYRSFTSIVGVLATLVTVLVIVVGAAAVAFLVHQGQPIRAAAALALTFIFAFFIALLVPRIDVTLYDDGQPALTISQRATLPWASYLVATPNGEILAELRRAVLSSLGRHRWTISRDGRFMGEAVEESFGRSIVRKIAGKFHRRFETNIHIVYSGLDAGAIIRRPDSSGRTDVLDLTGDRVDPRIAVALATLVLGREP